MSIKQEQCTLPLEKVFSIQIGTELFRLSGASIASDAPSYFSQFFETQLSVNGDVNLRTLYIDRDPGTFQEIARHLQGYHVRPRDSTEFVKLFADAQFYGLPRLTSQLFESDIFVQIGGRQFQIPRDIFSSPGNSPNFFSLGFADFFASPSEVFPGLDRTGLLRPPAIEPPSVPNRSGDVFAELLHMLQGYPLEIRSGEHQEQLLRDCRYYHLRGLEQRLIPHDIRTNPITQRSEIVIRLEDLRPSGLEFIPDDDQRQAGWMGYARPFTSEKPHDLIIETNNETTLVSLTRVRFSGPTSARIASLTKSAVSKFSPDVSLMEENKADTVSMTILDDADVTVNGQTDNILVSPGAYPPELPSATKRPRLDEPEDSKWFVRRGQWRVRVGKPIPSDTRVQLSLSPVKLDLYTRQKELNRTRRFLR